MYVLQLELAFTGCPGFLQIIIYGFRHGSIIANYTAEFAADVILSSGSDVVDFISTNVTETLKHAVVEINGTAIEVDPGNMTEVASKNVQAFESDPCSHLTNSICDYCYHCAIQTTVFCRPRCPDIHSQRCIIVNYTDDSAEHQCICNDHYFAVGEKCVSENLVIGVTVGIGGAIIIGLFIGIIVIGFRLNKTKKKLTTRTLDREPPILTQMETDESIEILDEENGDDINDVGDQPPYTVIPVIDARVAPTIVESDSNAQSTLPVSNGDETDDDLPIEIRESEAYKNFVPQLNEVDSEKEFKITRPRFPANGHTFSEYKVKDYVDSSFF